MREWTEKNMMRRKVIAVAAVAIIALILLEVYAHNYVLVRHLPTFTEEEALGLIPFYYNSTYTFSGNGARWLVALQVKKPTPSMNPATVYIFKIGQNGSFPTQSTDILILGINPTAGNRTGYFWASVSDIIYESNCTVIQIEYDLGVTGVFQVDFGLRVRVYEEMILGLIPREEIEIPLNATLVYG